MVMTKRRKQERQRKTDEIIDAAEKIFIEKDSIKPPWMKYLNIHGFNAALPEI